MSMNRKIGTISKKFFRPYEGIYKFGASGIITKSIYGQDTITLTNAIMNKLIELRAFGGTKQNGTPTPTSPIDILCNNGTLKGRKESGLPLRYKKVEYITASSTQWLNTGIKLASTDIVEAEYKNSSSSGYGALYGVFALGDSSAFYANGTYYGYDVSNDKVNTGVSVDTARHTLRHDFVNGVITLDDTTTTFTPFTFDNSRDNHLFSRYYNNSYGYGFKGSCRKYRIYRGEELICDLIPVIDTQNNDEPGMFDLVSGSFKGNVGTGNFTAGADVQDNIEIYVDGTSPNAVEKIKDELGNLATCENLFGLGDIKDEQEILSGSIIRKIGIKVLDGTENWITGNGGVRYNFQGDVGSFEKTSMLCSHYNYAGANVSITDMSSNQFSANSNGNISFKSAETTSASDFKTRLSNQVSAGTPVFVIYQKQNPTTDTVARQTLDIQTGTNVIEITQASISPLDLFAKYKATE